MRGLITAIRTLSILPAPGPEAVRLADSLPWFPAVGALLGWLLAGLALGLGRLSGDWPEGIAFVVLVAGVLLTRGFHLDGLADCADGLGGGYTRERSLEIMKDSRIGAFGVTALVLLLLGKWLCLARLVAAGRLWWLPTAWIVSRTLPVFLSCFFPYARKEGTGAAFVRDCRRGHLAGALALGSVLIWLGGGAGHLAAWLPALVWAAAWGGYCRHRLGGVTGDVLGATVEVGEVLVLAMGCLT
jgi:adenosylcobinamide-GDP ribazoletransferase